MKQKDIDALGCLVEDNGLETILEALKRISSGSIHPALLAAAIRLTKIDFDRDTDVEETKRQNRIDWLAREIIQERAKTAEVEAERARLSAWLERIDGGDEPCTNESVLRQWAYEAITLGWSADEHEHTYPIDGDLER